MSDTPSINPFEVVAKRIAAGESIELADPEPIEVSPSMPPSVNLAAQGRPKNPDGRPAVSVILPLYNYEQFVDEAIQSVRDQTFEDWELVIVDDGSTDSSAARAEAHIKSDDRIRLVSHPENKGLSSTRNTGFAYARGDYLCLLDADDAYFPDKLERQVSVMDQNPCTAMLYGPAAGYHLSELPPYNYDQLCKHNIIPCQSIMIPRNVLSIIGGNIATMPYAEDWEQWLRLAAISSNAIAQIDGPPFYKIRTHPGQYGARTANKVASIEECEGHVRTIGRLYTDTLSRAPVSVLHLVPQMNYGGAHHVVLNICRHLGPPSFQMTVATEEIGAAAHALKEIAPQAKIVKAGDVRPQNYDIVHIHSWTKEAESINKLAQQRIPLQVVITEHSEFGPDTPVVGGGHESRRVYVSDTLPPPETVGEYFPSKIAIPNGVHVQHRQTPEAMKVARSKLNLPADKTLIVTLSRTAPQKAPDRFFKMAKCLATKHPGRFAFVFVGSHERMIQHAECVEMAAEIKSMGKFCELIEFTEHKRALGYMLAADLFVLLSKTEAMPLALLEALAADVSSIATDVGGVPTVIPPERLVPRDSTPEQCADFVEKALTMPLQILRKAPPTSMVMAWYYALLYRTNALYLGLQRKD